MAKKRSQHSMRCRYFRWRLYQRDGVWYADCQDAPRGQRWRRSLGTRDRSQAEESLVEYDKWQAAEAGVIPRSPAADSKQAPALVIAEGRRLYLEHVQRPTIAGGVQASTAKRYRTALDKLVEFALQIGIRTWQQVDQRLLEALAAKLEQDGYQQKSIHNDLSTVLRANHWLVAEGRLAAEHKIVMTLKRAESRPPYCWRPEEVAAMLAHCAADPALEWLRVVIQTLATTGMRISEVVNLRWDDVDFKGKRISLTDETGQSAKNGSRRRLKSGRSRSIPLHDELSTTLSASKRCGAYVFRGPRGGRLKADTVRRCLTRDVLKPLANRFPEPIAGRRFVEGTPHSFRHYFCSTCANSGVPIRMLMAWLGHADSSMVDRYYHLHDQDSHRRIQGIDFLGGPSDVLADAPTQNSPEKENAAERTNPSG